MHSTAKIIGYVCIGFTIILWIVTLVTDPAPGSIGAAAALTAIVAALGTLSLWS